MSSPIGAVQASNAQKGVKRPLLNNPVNVPSQLPGFRGRVVDAGAPIKVPKLRNGNLNNETSNVRVPYSRVTPLEFLSSYTGRLSPGDVVFVHKYPPGFVSAQQHASNATLGVNTLSRVVGLDGLNRLLMGSNPDGWQVGKNVLWLNKNKDKKLVPSDVTSGGNVSKFMLTVLDEYRLDGVVISNDEPGAFTSSGARDNALFNVAIQGPTEVNNGFLEYEEEQDESQTSNSTRSPARPTPAPWRRTRAARPSRADTLPGAPAAACLGASARRGWGPGRLTLSPTSAARTACTRARCSIVGWRRSTRSTWVCARTISAPRARWR